jgi:RNA polymerase sigma-70 factor (ECF subfamily)
MSRVDLDDAAVIEASRADPDRFASLFDRHAPHIHRYLARRAGRQAADDLVAETFLVAFRKRAGYAQSIRVMLAGALAGLARPDRDVLLLIAWEQLSYEEVAQALGVRSGRTTTF